uniref:Secreted protein n=1 Tax=Plectus sambesii TaxID=2011161 RepID=A0A914UN67_9BILA
MMPIAGKLVAVLVLSSFLLLQQVQARPATQRSPATTNERDPHNIHKRDIDTNDVYGYPYPGYGAVDNFYGYDAQPRSHRNAIWHGDGNMFYLMCTDCGHGR